MASKKMARPCNFCKGQGKHRCIICGWKKEERSQHQLSKMEQAVLAGKRNRAEFLHELDCGSTKAGNCSVDDILPDQREAKKDLVQVAVEIDSDIENHRRWAYSLYHRHKIKFESIKSIAKSEDMNVSLVIRMIRMVQDKLNRNDFEYAPRGPTPVNPIPELPPFHEGHVRRTIVMEDVDD